MIRTTNRHRSVYYNDELKREKKRRKIDKNPTRKKKTQMIHEKRQYKSELIANLSTSWTFFSFLFASNIHCQQFINDLWCMGIGPSVLDPAMIFSSFRSLRTIYCDFAFVVFSLHRLLLFVWLNVEKWFSYFKGESNQYSNACPHWACFKCIN